MLYKLRWPGLILRAVFIPQSWSLIAWNLAESVALQAHEQLQLFLGGSQHRSSCHCLSTASSQLLRFSIFAAQYFCLSGAVASVHYDFYHMTATYYLRESSRFYSYLPFFPHSQFLEDWQTSCSYMPMLQQCLFNFCLPCSLSMQTTEGSCLWSGLCP